MKQQNVKSEKILFGQWLVLTKQISLSVLKTALLSHGQETSEVLKNSSRLLGQIFYEDFRTFRNRVELNKALVNFNKHRSRPFPDSSEHRPTDSSASSYQMCSSHRLPGEILANDFHVFSNRVELNRLLIQFNEFKSNLENQRTDLMILQQKGK